MRRSRSLAVIASGAAASGAAVGALTGWFR